MPKADQPICCIDLPIYMWFSNLAYCFFALENLGESATMSDYQHPETKLHGQGKGNIPFLSLTSS